MLTLIPFKAHHLLAYRAQEPLDLSADQLLDLGRIYEANGPGFTGLVDQMPVASAGLKLLQPRVAEAWAFISPEAPRKSLHVHTKSMLRDAIQGLNLRRVQAGVIRGLNPYCRWLEALGFTDPVLLRAYGPNGEDYLLYSIVRT